MSRPTFICDDNHGVIACVARTPVFDLQQAKALLGVMDTAHEGPPENWPAWLREGGLEVYQRQRLDLVQCISRLECRR